MCFKNVHKLRFHLPQNEASFSTRVDLLTIYIDKVTGNNVTQKKEFKAEGAEKITRRLKRCIFLHCIFYTTHTNYFETMFNLKKCSLCKMTGFLSF